MVQVYRSYQVPQLPLLVQVSPLSQEFLPRLEAPDLLVVQLALVAQVDQDHPLCLVAQHFLVFQHFQ